VVAIRKDMDDFCEVVTTHSVRGILPSGCLKRRPPPVSDDKIPWRLRWRIALDVAKGMRYLHSYNPPIVHRDLRSPNIFVRRHSPTPFTVRLYSLHPSLPLTQLASLSPSSHVVAKIGDFGTSLPTSRARSSSLMSQH
jgi:serine/threonine protein kinase